jgi:hypothetical protein
MKTSNKILMAAAFVLIAWLVIYDNALKAEYVKGDFKKPHFHMEQLNFSTFNTIENNAGNIIGLQIEKGPYGIWIRSDIKDKVKISKHGQTLQIEYIGNEDINFVYSDAISITCPSLISMTTNPFMKPGTVFNGRYVRKRGTSMVIEYYPHGTTTVTGFDEPSMSIQANEFTEIHLENNTIGQLHAQVGDSKKGNAGVTIGADNKITDADLLVPGKSSLILDNVAIGKITYKMADSADVQLTGKSVHLLDHQ